MKEETAKRFELLEKRMSVLEANLKTLTARVDYAHGTKVPLDMFDDKWAGQEKKEP